MDDSVFLAASLVRCATHLADVYGGDDGVLCGMRGLLVSPSLVASSAQHTAATSSRDRTTPSDVAFGSALSSTDSRASIHCASSLALIASAARCRPVETLHDLIDSSARATSPISAPVDAARDDLTRQGVLPAGVAHRAAVPGVLGEHTYLFVVDDDRRERERERERKKERERERERERELLRVAFSLQHRPYVITRMSRIELSVGHFKHRNHGNWNRHVTKFSHIWPALYKHARAKMHSASRTSRTR